MEQKEKELLLKDLCARLPYGVKCKYYDCYEGDYDEGTALGFEREEFIHIHGRCIHIEEIKLYLFPLSSMTEEQRKECYDIVKYKLHPINQTELTDWYHKNHIDYRGLIPLGLALDATGLSIYN